MATRVTPTAPDADNYVGSLAAACNDWRDADADSMSARDISIPLTMPDIRLQAITRSVINYERSSTCGGVHIRIVRPHFLTPLLRATTTFSRNSISERTTCRM